MSSPGPARDPAYATALLGQATALHLEAERLIQDLDLRAILAGLGPTELVGSVASGLMVWRDIDVCVACPGLTPERAWTALRPLLHDPRLASLDYRNETGAWALGEDPADQRLYLVLHYVDASGAEWKIDLSLWTVTSPRAPGELLADLEQTLTPETRLAILWIKDRWHRLPVYPDTVGGFEVYDAVLHHGVRTPEAFDDYLRQHGLPGRDRLRIILRPLPPRIPNTRANPVSNTGAPRWPGLYRTCSLQGLTFAAQEQGGFLRQA